MLLFVFHFSAAFSEWYRELMEKEMATHSNILLWEIPWTEELQTVGYRQCGCIRHDLVTKSQSPPPLPNLKLHYMLIVVF